MTQPAPDSPQPGAVVVEVCRHRNGDTEICSDTVAEECPVALVYNGIAHTVMMASPADLELFAIGFSLSEGIVSGRKDIFDIEVIHHQHGAEVQLRIAQSAFSELKQHRRTLAGRTGCGVCGIESLELLDLQPEMVSAAVPLAIDGALINHILQQLPQYQPLTQSTGCAHAAAWCDGQGNILRVFEDVGRHNALDKLLGWLAQHEVSTHEGLLFLTSRASYELIRKAARRNIGVIATISAPTALAINIARTAGIRLLSFCRSNGFVEY